MIKRLVAIILVISILALVIAGCSSTPTTTQPPQTTTQPTTSAPASTSAPATTTQAAGKVYKWKLQPYISESDNSVNKNVDKLIEMINTNTKGQIQITKYPFGSIVQQATDVVTATGTGVLNMSVTIGGQNAGVIPSGVVEDGLPMQWMNKKIMDDVIFAPDGFNAIFRPEYAKQGAYLLGVYDAGGVGITLFTTKQINSLADLKGKKIRSWSIYLTLLGNLGASPITMALGEVYSALQMGALDGCLVASSMVPLNKFNEVAGYGYLPQLAWGATHNVLINQNDWNSLPKDLQDIVTNTFNEWRVWDADIYNPQYNYVTVEALQKLGVKFSNLPDSDVATIRAESEKLWDTTAAKDATAAKAIDYIRKYNAANPSK